MASYQLTGILEVLVGVAVLSSCVVRVRVRRAAAIVGVGSSSGVAVTGVELVLEVANLGHCCCLG